MIKKLISLFSIFLAISVITFFLVKLSPGDPAQNYLRASHVSITAETLTAARKNLGLDKPLYIQYFNWLTNILKGDFGISYTKKAPVIELVNEAIVPTFQLGIFSFVILLKLFASSFILVFPSIVRRNFAVLSSIFKR